MATKILVMKLGYSETLDEEIGKVPSLGDVLRTTPILWALREKFPDAHISWIVAQQAEPLLRHNPLIDRLMVWDEFVPFQLMREKFDVLVNLEKIPGVCAVADMIDAWTKYGFRFDSVSGTYQAYERGLAFIEYIQDKKRTSRAKDVWAKVLVEMLGVEWRNQPSILGYQPRTKETFDIGFNYKVGPKWPTKGLPDEKWKILEDRLKRLGYTVSWQQGKDDLFEYMDWIHSCRVLISSDSLGLHIALAMKKGAVGLFGPTDPVEVGNTGNIQAVCARQNCIYMPCYHGRCTTGFECMRSIDLNEVVKIAHYKLMEMREGTVPALNLNEAVEKIAVAAHESAQASEGVVTALGRILPEDVPEESDEEEEKAELDIELQKP